MLKYCDKWRVWCWARIRQTERICQREVFYIEAGCYRFPCPGKEVNWGRLEEELSSCCEGLDSHLKLLMKARSWLGDCSCWLPVVAHQSALVSGGTVGNKLCRPFHWFAQVSWLPFSFPSLIDQHKYSPVTFFILPLLFILALGVRVLR